MMVYEEVRRCLRPGRGLEGSCSPVERVWIVRRGHTRRCLAAVPVEVLGEYVKARREKRGNEFR